tara:strand:- start:901 stop:2046 length:1146 start_codon:yes stop_codon:yes gene_type:complete
MVRKKLKLLDNALKLILPISALSGEIKRQIFGNKIFNKKINVGIIKLSAFGDVIKVSDALSNCIKFHDQYDIKLITTERSNPKFFKDVCIIDSVLVFSPLGLVLLWLKNLFWSKFDYIIDLDQSYKISECIALTNRNGSSFLTPKKGKWSFKNVTYDPQGQETDNFENLICVSLGIENSKNGIDALKINFNEMPKILEDNIINFSNIIAIYPGSSTNAIFRRWPIENYALLCKELKKYYNIIIIGGPDEVNLVPYFENAGLGKHLFINKFSLQQWAYIFKYHVSLFIGNDAGLLHLADSQRTKCFGIYGPNIFEKWGASTFGSKGFWHDVSCRPCILSGHGIVPDNCARGVPECVTKVKIKKLLDFTIKEMEENAFVIKKN